MFQINSLSTFVNVKISNTLSCLQWHYKYTRPLWSFLLKDVRNFWGSPAVSTFIYAVNHNFSCPFSYRCLFHSLSTTFLMIFGHWIHLYLVKGQSDLSSHGLQISWRDALQWPRSITIRSAWKYMSLVKYLIDICESKRSSIHVLDYEDSQYHMISHTTPPVLMSIKKFLHFCSFAILMALIRCLRDTMRLS